MRLPGGASLSRARLDDLTDRAKSLGAKGLAWFRVTGRGSRPPLARHLSKEETAAIAAVDGASVGDLVLVVADEHATACSCSVRCASTSRAAGGRRTASLLLGDRVPALRGLDADGTPIPAHHPFTMPHPDDLDRLETDPLSVRSQSYDLVLNGWELGSGSIRIHRADIQRRIFAALRMSDEDAEARFGFLLGAFRYGAPPHGGFAFGIDRLAAIFAGEDNIREVIAFPKTQSGADLMTGAPGVVTEAHLRELGVAVRPPT